MPEFHGTLASLHHKTNEENDMKQTLKLSHDIWFSMSKENQQETAKKYVVVISPSYAPAPDLDQLREMAPVARCEVA